MLWLQWTTRLVNHGPQELICGPVVGAGQDMGGALWRSGASATSSYRSMLSSPMSKALIILAYISQVDDVFILSSVLKVFLVLTKLILGDKTMILSIHQMLTLLAEVRFASQGLYVCVCLRVWVCVCVCERLRN